MSSIILIFEDYGEKLNKKFRIGLEAESKKNFTFFNISFPIKIEFSLATNEDVKFMNFFNILKKI